MSQSHHHRRLQRRVLIIASVTAVIAVLIGVPLAISPELRLDVAYRLGVAPGADAEQIFAEHATVELLILVEEVPVELSPPTRRYHAVAVAERTADGILLHDINRDRAVSVPLDRYDRVAAATDRDALLLVDEQAADDPRAVLVTLSAGTVRKLPPGQVDPGIPGDWSGDIAGNTIDCGGVSPASTWVGCIDRRGRAGRYLAGDWELQAHPYGRPEETHHLYRGLGLLPIVGWSEDERWLYLQNESGIWRVAAPET
ncbi:MAG: hypothetical protein ACRDJH_09155 [Thermomicrobiales bacterium]